MDAGDGRRGKRSLAAARGYALTSLALIALFPFLPRRWRYVDLLVVCLAAAVCAAYGRRAVRREARLPWTLLVAALLVLVAGNVVPLVLGDSGLAAGHLIDAAGDLLMFAAALALVLRRGISDRGGVIDAGVIALAAGSLLWVVLPHRLAEDDGFPAQVNLFVVVFAFTGVVGALLRIAHTTSERGAALWWLMAAITFAIAGYVLLAVGGGDQVLRTGSGMLFLATFTSIGLFGLDPSGPRLVEPPPVAQERLSASRLAFLGVAVAVIPVVVGTRELLAGDAGGTLLAVQGALVAVLVMARIGLLSAQRTRAEQALEHQAAHDPLTLLPNRRQLIARLREELDRGARCLLLFCDLDNFKSINDEFGHDVGDRLLIEVARRLRECVGDHMISRYGGDEFVVLLVNTTLAHARNAGDCIRETLRDPFPQAGGARIAVSIGIAQADGERDAEELLRSADRAMYREKTQAAPSVARPTRSPSA